MDDLVIKVGVLKSEGSYKKQGFAYFRCICGRRVKVELKGLDDDNTITPIVDLPIHIDEEMQFFKNPDMEQVERWE